MRPTSLLILLLVTSCVASTTESEDCEGEKCDLIGTRLLAESCVYDWLCDDESDLICRPTSRVPFEPKETCQYLGVAGDHCHADDDCVLGSVCRGVDHLGSSRSIYQAGTCETSELGATCFFDAECDSEVCRPSSPIYGELEDRCQPKGEADALCTADDDCTAGTICRSIDHEGSGPFIAQAGRCRASGALGATCFVDAECDEVCRPSSPVYGEMEERCQSKGLEGDHCAADDDCVGLRCSGAQDSGPVTVSAGKCEA